MASKKFKVQLSEEASSRAARRVLLNAETLRSLKLSTGDVVAVTKTIGSPVFAVGVVWPSIEQSADSVHLSAAHILTAQLQSSQDAFVVPLSMGKPSANGFPSLKQIQDARVIRLKEVSVFGVDSSKILQKQDTKQKQRDWLSLLLRETLVDLKYITPTQTIQVVYEGVPRRYIVSSVSSAKSTDSVDDLATSFESLQVKPAASLWTASWDSSIAIVGKNESTPTTKPDVEVLNDTPADSAYASVGGLSKQISEIRDLLEIPLTRPDLFRYFGLKPPRGILLHGPPGTGKTHLARAIAQSTKSNVIVINGPELSSAYHGETEAKLRDVFKQAREKSPCIVVLDEVDALVPNRDGGAGGGGGEGEVEKRVVATLLTILDGMETEGEGEEEGESKVVVIGTTNRPNAIDPALRRPGRFDREIEIGVPDAEARLSILQVLLSKTPHNISVEDLRTVASRAHGYVGADLSAVVREAGTVAIKRLLAVDPTTTSPSPSPLLTLPDLLTSLPTIRPSAMRSLFIDSPRITYSEIGGQPNVIPQLRQAVEWPLRHPEAFTRLGVKPPKGVLLYGPPGCSKTVLARACACESGVNFLAVKGPELLNKFVGESERAVREIFRKARAASPSIIFFDEIDALATSRMSESNSDSGSGSSHEGVLTSLLNEMDGVQELVGVTVVAATNRPEAIDPALMRSGRLDRILYVGPPDQQGREEILRIRMRGMKVEEGVDVRRIAEVAEGCSGAEISALCQEAALLTMQRDMDAPYVPQEAFLNAAKSMQRQITPAMLQKYERWKIQSGLHQM